MTAKHVTHIAPAAPKVPATPKAPKAPRKKVEPPPVIDRVGADLGGTESEDDTDEITVPVPTDDTPSPTPAAAASPVTPAAPSTAMVSTSSTSTAIAPTSTSTGTAALAATPTPPASNATTTTSIDVTSVPVMAAPPSVTIPVVPSGFIAVPGSALNGYRPMQAELTYVPDAILELQSIPNWALIFGMTAPAAPQVAQRLSVAMQWTSLFADSEDWYNYVKSQEGVAWKDALEVIEALKAPFQLATAANPAMMNQYPAMQRLLGAQKVVAKKAITTKKNKAAANAATAAAAAASTPATAPAVAATPTDGAATPARVVTISG